MSMHGVEQPLLNCNALLIVFGVTVVQVLIAYVFMFFSVGNIGNKIFLQHIHCINHLKICLNFFCIITKKGKNYTLYINMLRIKSLNYIMI